MKKFLSILGTIGLVSSATLVATSASQLESKQVEVVTNPEPARIDYSDNDLAEFKTLVESLSEWEFNSLDQELENIFKTEDYNLAIAKINSSNNETINSNKLIIENYFAYYYQTEVLKKSDPSISGFLNLPQIDWSQINNLISGVGFTSSSDYNVSTQWYGPSAWWRFWQWGLQVNFHEGVINLMRLVNFSFNFFNGTNFAKLEEVTKEIKTFLNYLFNLDDHDSDNISVLYDHTVRLRTYLETLNVPFTQQFWSIFKTAEKELGKYLNGGDFIIWGVKVHVDKVSIFLAKDFINQAIKQQTGLTLKELDNKFSPALNDIISGIKQVNDTLTTIRKWVPGFLYDYLSSGIRNFSRNLINNDSYKRGTYMRFQQGFIFVGFGAK